jgi:DNA-binding response OmpR family regulator
MAFLQSDQQQLELWEIYEVLEKNEDQLPKQALEAQIYRLRKKMRDCGAGKQVLRANRLQGYQLCCAVKID